MRKILQAFKKLFSRKKEEETVYYICDPEKARKCTKEGCWYISHGPCRCTKHKTQAKTDRDGRPVIATMMDVWNEEFREYCLDHPDVLLKE